jgi:hypothetical protein
MCDRVWVVRASVPFGAPYQMGLSLPLAAVPQNPNRQDRCVLPHQAAVLEERVVREPALCCNNACNILR